MSLTHAPFLPAPRSVIRAVISVCVRRSEAASITPAKALCEVSTPVSMTSTTCPWPLWEAAAAPVIREAAPRSDESAGFPYPPWMLQKSGSVTGSWYPSTKAPATPCVALMAESAESGALIATPSKACV